MRALLEIDGALQPSGATIGLATALAKLEPYGAGNPRPVFALPDLRVTWASVVGNGHVRCTVVGTGGAKMQAIGFRCAETALGKALHAANGPPMHLAGTVKLDTWQGQQRVQFTIEDGARVG